MRHRRLCAETHTSLKRMGWMGSVCGAELEYWTIGQDTVNTRLMSCCRPLRAGVTE